MKTFLGLTILIFLSACATTSSSKRGGAPSTAKGRELPASTANKKGSFSSETNNQISITTTVEATGNGPGSKVIFKGSNNLLEVVQHNPTFFDQAQDVIIIEGNGNTIRLYNSRLVNFKATNKPDTLVLVGNKQKYVVDLWNNLKLKKAPLGIDTVEMQTRPLVPGSFTQDLENNAFGLGLVQDLLGSIAKGEQESYLKLAEVYHYGLHEIPVSYQKAVEVYEYAAIKGEVDAIRRLGDIWFNGTFDVKQDPEKARYYYKLGARLGDEHCKKQLEGE